jgi:nitroreductase
MTKSTRRMEEDGKALAQNMPNVPVLVFVFADTRIVNEIATRTVRTAISLRIPSAVRGIDLTEAASIYPAVQNLLLAAKGLGIAACLTTSITLAEKRAKEILKVPKQFRLFCLVYLGYPASTTMKPPVRRPVEELVAYDQAGFE